VADLQEIRRRVGLPPSSGRAGTLAADVWGIGFKTRGHHRRLGRLAATRQPERIKAEPFVANLSAARRRGTATCRAPTLSPTAANDHGLPPRRADLGKEGPGWTELSAARGDPSNMCPLRAGPRARPYRRSSSSHPAVRSNQRIAGSRLACACRRLWATVCPRCSAARRRYTAVAFSASRVTVRRNSPAEQPTRPAQPYATSRPGRAAGSAAANLHLPSVSSMPGPRRHDRVCPPNRRASKRWPHCPSQRNAATIHRPPAATPWSRGPSVRTRRQTAGETADLVVIDNLDVDVNLAQLSKPSRRESATCCCVGDVDHLPLVAPGGVLGTCWRAGPCRRAAT